MKNARKTIAFLLFLSIIAGVMSPSSAVVQGVDVPVEETHAAEEIYARDYDESEQTLITAEVMELRTETEKHFRHKDGSFTVSMYSEPVHFQDANGTWQDIDNTLELSNSKINAAGKAVYTPKASGVDVRIPQDFSEGQSITVEKDGYQIAFGVATDAQSELISGVLPELFSENAPIESADEVDATEESTEAAVEESAAEGAADDMPVETAEEVETETIDDVLTEETPNDMLLEDEKPDVNEPSKKLSLPSESAVAMVKAVVSPAEIKDAADDMTVKSVEEQNAEIMRVNTKPSAVTYQGVLQGDTLEYILCADRIKESIIVSEPKKDYQYLFSMDCGGLKPQQQADGSIALYGENDETPVYMLEAPYMFDADGNSSNAVKMSLADGFLFITADSGWINDEERVFPVTIDPSVIIRNGINGQIEAKTIPSPILVSNRLVVGNFGALHYRTFLKFSLPTLPDSSVVSDASLSLWQASGGSMGTSSLCAYDLSEQASWTFSSLGANTQPVSSSLISPNSYEPDFPAIIDYVPFSTSENSNLLMNITGVVRKWYEHGNNNGILLASNAESNSSEISYSFLYLPTASNPERRPSVIIHYNTNIGLEDCWSYQSADLGRSGIVYVNEYNGSVTYQHSDLAMTGNRLPINVSHYFNNQGNAVYADNYSAMSIGMGFHLNLQELMLPIPSNDALYLQGYRFRYYDGDGTERLFCQDGDQIHDEYNELLTVAQNGSDYVLSDEKGNRKIFNSSGQLIQLKDCRDDSQYITVQDGRINAVTDPAGRSALFTYNAYNQLTAITDPAGRSTYFSYSGSGVSSKLVQIQYPDDNTTTFQYDLSGSVTRITAFDGQYATCSYTQSYGCGKRVETLCKYTENGAATEDYLFEYVLSNSNSELTGHTRITDQMADNQYINCLFDSLGRTIEKVDQDYHMQFASYASSVYGAQANQFNQILNASGLIAMSGNLVANSGFESDSTGNWSFSPSQGGSVSMTNEAYSIGFRSLKVTGSGSASYSLENVQSGKEYSVSADVYIPAEQSGATVQIGFSFAGNYYLGSPIKSTEGWERVSYSAVANSVYSPKVHIIVSGSADSIAFVDDVQVEMGEVSAEYNLLENSDFFRTLTSYDLKYPAGWTYDFNNDNGGVLTTDGRNYMLLYGETTKTKTVSQIVKVNAEPGETLVIGGAVSAKAKSGTDGNHFFGIRATVLDENGTPLSGDQYSLNVPFDPSVNGCLQTNARCYKVPASGCAQVLFSFEYSMNINIMQIAGSFVYKMAFGDHYVYDDGTSGGSGTGQLLATYNDEGTAYQYGYNEDNLVSNVSRSVSGVQETVADIYYNIQNNPTYIVNNNGSSVEYLYTNGQPSVIYMNGNNGEYGETRITYIQGGNYPKFVWDSENNLTVYEYDDSNNAPIGLVKKIREPNGNITTFEYDPDTDELISTTGAATTALASATSLTYDHGLLSALTRGSLSYSYAYNGSNQCVSSSIGPLVLTTAAYDARQRLASFSYANGMVYTPEYNDRNQLVTESWNNEQTAAYHYNTSGQLVRLEDLENEKSYQFEYAFYGLPHRTVCSDGSNVMYRYDRSGLLCNLTAKKNDAILYSSNMHAGDKGQPEQVDVSLNYDNADEPENVVSIHSNYDDFGRLVGQSDGKLVSEITYDISRVSALQVTDDEENLIADYAYAYDRNGNLLSATDNVTGWSNTCTYDELNRPVSAVYTHRINDPIPSNYTYEYNTNGQLTAIKSGTNTIRSFTYGDPNRPDLMTSYNTTYDNISLSYDAYGNMTHFNGCTYTWKHGSRLESFSDDISGRTWTYHYDIYGNCVRKVLTQNNAYLGEITLEYADGLLIRQQETDDDPVFFAYDGAGAPVGFSYRSHFYSYAKNHLGDVLAIVKDTGDVVYRYGYDAFGNVFRSSGDMSFSTRNPYRTHGCVYDVTSGLSRVNGRYYFPQIKSYVTPEPALATGLNDIKGSLNKINGQASKISMSEVDIDWDTVANTVWPISKSISLLLKPITDTIVADLSNQMLDEVKKTINAPKGDFSRSKFGRGLSAVLGIGSKILFTVLPPIETTFDYPTGLRHFMPVDMSFGAPWASYFLGFSEDKDNKGVYSSGTIHNMWQSRVGYTPTYDFFFSLGGPIFREKYEFEISNNNIWFPKTYYVVWIWKGDYWNLGAGAEIGIYKTIISRWAERHFYQVDTDETLDVLMKIDYRKDGISSNNLYSAESAATNWWVCVFCSEAQLPWVDWLDIEMKVKFNNSSLISPFYATYQSKNGNNDPDDDWNEITQILSPPFTGQELSGFQFQLNY